VVVPFGGDGMFPSPLFRGPGGWRSAVSSLVVLVPGRETTQVAT